LTAESLHLFRIVALHALVRLGLFFVRVNPFGPVDRDLLVLGLLFLEAGPEVGILVFLSQAYSNMAPFHVPFGFLDVYFTEESHLETENLAFVVVSLEGEDSLGAQVDLLFVKVGHLDRNEDHLLTLGPFDVWENFR